MTSSGPDVSEISVVTPVFNGEKYLPGCIESVSRQTQANVDHIVVDGASTDSTLDIIRSSAVRWISESDDGMYDAVNKGLKLAQSQIVGYLNADDRLFPDSLKLICDLFNKKSDIDFVYGHCTYIDEDERPLATFRPSPLSGRISGKSRITFAQPTVYWRSRVHSKIGYFNTQYKTAGDADFFYRMINSGFRGQLIQRPIAEFMVRPTALSSVMQKEMGREINQIREANGISPLGPTYVANEISYYLANSRSYARYFWNKRIRSRLTRR